MQQELIRDLEQALPAGAVLSEPHDLLLYDTDASVEVSRAECVVFPSSTADVVRIVELANRYDVPLVGRGAGTGLSGGALTRHGGILIVFSRMNRILELDRRKPASGCPAGRRELRTDARRRIRRAAFRAGSFQPEGVHDRRQRLGKFRRPAHAGLWRHHQSRHRPRSGTAQRRGGADRRQVLDRQATILPVSSSARRERLRWLQKSR